MLGIDGDTCTVQLPSGPSEFRSTTVKPYMEDPVDDIQAIQEPVQSYETVAASDLSNTGVVKYGLFCNLHFVLDYYSFWQLNNREYDLVLMCPAVIGRYISSS